MTVANLHRLSDNLSALYGDTEADITLYDTNPLLDESEAKITLSDGEMWQLIEYYLDGYCHVCGDSIPQYHNLCHNCAVKENQKWHGY